MNNDEYLKDKAFEGLEKKGLSSNPEYIDRLNEEIETIVECGLSDFMLVTAYTVLSCKSKGILCGPGRGSVSGSLLAYCIGITEVDPIKYDLSFARFLNKARMQTSLGDIDIDVPRKDRPEVLKLLKSEFGEDKTIQIINDVYFTPKTALKDLGRIYGVSFSLLNKLTSLIDEDSDDPYNAPEVVDFLNKHIEIKELLPEIVGLIRHSSKHAGGVLISDKPITDYISTLRVGGDTLTCYNGKTCESLNFLKQDILGLNTLSIIKDCLLLIGKEKFDFDYDLDDINIYNTINKSTLGIFQLEGRGATDYVLRLKPQNFNDIVLALALVRPGAQDSGDADEFLKVRFEGQDIHYDDDSLIDILKETNGCIIFQEQAMRISRVLSGFTDVEADNLRRGIGKKLNYIFEEYKPRFINGAINNNVSKEVAETIWNKIEKASSYSFNKSHAVGYALITYQTAYLKTYYPIEYYTAMLNNTEDDDKRVRIYNEIKSIGKNLINPDINISKDKTIYDEDNIYLSFLLINGVGPVAVDDIIKNQPYSSFEDFMERRAKSKVNKSVVKALIEAGAFDRFDRRRDELYSIVTEEECHWDDKEVLYHEFDRIKINPKSNVLDLYDTKEIGIDLPLTSVKGLKNNVDDYNDFYIKLLPSEFKKKDDYAFVSATDGYDSISIYVAKQFLSRYVDSLKSIGTPLLCHVHGKGEKYSLVSLINLQDLEKYKHEYWYYTGESINKVKALQEANPGINCCVASNVNFFTSKNGNPCVRYNAVLDRDNTLEGRIQVNPPLMIEGSFIFFEIGNNPVFLSIQQVA